MVNIATAMFQPKSEIAMEYTQEVLERGRDLARSQLEVTENMYSEAMREYRELLSMSEPAEIFQSWPKVVESTVRNAAEGAASIMRNGMAFQNELIALMQDKVPAMNQQIINGLIEKTKAAGVSVAAAVAQVQRPESNGRSQPVRASKAA